MYRYIVSIIIIYYANRKAANDKAKQQTQTRSTGRVHTSTKARLSSAGDVMTSQLLAMPASACPALQRRAAQSVNTTFRISQ